jgi:thioredoxin 1
MRYKVRHRAEIRIRPVRSPKGFPNTQVLIVTRASVTVPAGISGMASRLPPVSPKHRHSQQRFNRVSNPHIVHTSDSTFGDDVLKSQTPVLLDFWAEWCGPCKMIAPILDEIANEYQGRVKVAKLNIDENPQTPPKFGIRGIPTLILFKNGTVEAQKVGALSKSQLSAFLDSNL